jgi:aryl-alcohol dehydrogenase-like predicted oxidoreductase
MQYRPLGRTGLAVSALALGTVELGLDYGIEAQGEFGRPTQAEAVRLVHAALDAGITFVDTARAYGDSERVLGIALADRCDEVVLETKVDPRPPAGVTWSDAELRDMMLASLETSLRLLRTDHVDVWMIHSIDERLLERREVLAGVFEEAQSSGKIGWSGASFYGAALPETALAYDLFDVMQITYSVLDQRLSERVLPLAADKGVGVVARSVLLKGALTERAEYLPDRLEPLRAHSRQFRQLVAAMGDSVTPAQGAIAFALAHPQIDTVLVGARTESELAEDLAALEIRYSEAELESLAALGIDDAAMLDPSTWGIP